MTTLSLDGNISYTGTEFIKLLNTGSSHLATEEYVDDKVADAIGGSSVDAYTKAEADALLNAKLNVSNPDVSGNLRVATGGGGKLIVNASTTPASESLYVQGLSTFTGTVKVPLLQANSNIETTQKVRSDVYDTNSNVNMKIQRNTIDYIVLESDKINLKKDLYVNDVLFTGVDAYTKGETDAVCSGSLNVASLQSTGNVETATTIKTNNFENYDSSNVIFSHDAVNYLGFNKDTGTLLAPNDDANVKVGVFFEGNRTIKATEGFVGSLLNNDDASSAPRFTHLGDEYMRYEDVALNASTQGIKVAKSLYTQDINPSQIKMTYNTKISFTDSDGGTDGDYFNDNYLMMSIADTIPRLNYVVIDGSEHRFYVGDIGTAFDGDMVMKISKDRVDFYKPIYDGGQPLSSGGYSDAQIDTFLANKLTIASPETLTSKLVVEATGSQLALGDTTSDREIAIIDGDSIDCSEKAVSSNPAELKINYNRDANVRVGNTASSLSINTAPFTSKVLSVLGDSQFSGRLRLTSHLTLSPNLAVYFDEGVNKRYIRCRQLGGAPGYLPLDLVNEHTSLGRISMIIGTTDAFRIDNTSIVSFKSHTFTAGVKLTVLDSYYQNTNMLVQRGGDLYMTFSTTDQIILNKLVQFLNNSTDVNEIRNFATDEDINFIHEATTYLTYDYTNDNLICKSGFLTVENSLGCNTFVNRVAGQDVQFGYQGSAYLEYKHATDEVYINKATKITPALNLGGGASNTVIYEILDNTDNILHIKNTQAVGNPAIKFQVATQEVLSMEASFLKTTKLLNCEGGCNATTFDTPTGISGDTTFKREGATMMEFKTDGIHTPSNFIMTPNYRTYYDISTGNEQYIGSYDDGGIPSLEIVNATTPNANIFFKIGTLKYVSITTTKIDLNQDVEITATKKLTTPEIETNFFDTTSGNTLSINFNHDGTNYMQYDYPNTQFKFNVNVSSGYNITCVDLIETSDRRLKENIEDVDEECSEIVKKIKVKTYNLKSDDKKRNHIGFVAQEVDEILPEKFEAVVNTDSEFMGINYGKMSAILWKCCQEQQSKIEHLEASMYEMMEEIKELKGDKTGKGKAKAKAKSKAKNVD